MDRLLCSVDPTEEPIILSTGQSANMRIVQDTREMLDVKGEHTLEKMSLDIPLNCSVGTFSRLRYSLQLDRNDEISEYHTRVEGLSEDLDLAVYIGYDFCIEPLIREIICLEWLSSSNIVHVANHLHLVLKKFKQKTIGGIYRYLCTLASPDPEYRSYQEHIFKKSYLEYLYSRESDDMDGAAEEEQITLKNILDGICSDSLVTLAQQPQIRDHHLGTFVYLKIISRLGDDNAWKLVNYRDKKKIMCRNMVSLFPKCRVSTFLFTKATFFSPIVDGGRHGAYGWSGIHGCTGKVGKDGPSYRNNSGLQRGMTKCKHCTATYRYH